MPPGSRAGRALRHLHPPIREALVLLGLLSSTTLLFTGLSLPLMNSQKLFWKSSYSVWTGVVALWNANEILLAGVLFFFCLVFPITKLVALGVIWFMRLPEEQRDRLLHWLEILGKWSMLDVFVVAILIVLVKLGPLARVEPRVGVYVFCAAIISSMLTTMYVNRLASQSHR